jgi:multidrug efflux pump subunit AcrA (membrane-fusion protein)
VVTLSPGVETPVLTAFGEVRSRRTLEVRAPAEGRIIALSEAFEEGGAVSEGDFLLRIDPADADAALARARTDLRDAENELAEAERALSLAVEDVAAARRQADLRLRAFQRQQDLLDRGVGSAAAAEAAELAAATAEQAVLSRRQAEAQAEARLAISPATARRRTCCWWLLMAAGLAGACRNMRAQFFPDVIVDDVTVSRHLGRRRRRGCGRAIVQVLEPALLAVEGVESSSATAREGRASIELEFEPGWDMARAADDVQAAVDTITDLPEDAEEPEVRRGAWRDRVTDVVITGPVGADQLAASPTNSWRGSSRRASPAPRSAASPRRRRWSRCPRST